MMIGTVTTVDEAVLAVSVVGLPGSREERVEAVVDTGFTDHLTLRPVRLARNAASSAGSGSRCRPSARHVLTPQQ